MVSLWFAVVLADDQQAQDPRSYHPHQPQARWWGFEGPAVAVPWK
jgi:hypothetical protein